jgi:hypothetical protein
MLLFAFNALGQEEPRILTGEEEVVAKSSHSVRKATLMSTFVPGLGQAYNKKYWKIPIVYAALGTSIYFIFWNQEQYDEYRTAFDIREADGEDKYQGIYSSENLITLQNYYRNNRDLSIIIAVLVYGLNILDANIDAHLYDFDVSENLSMRIEPTILGRDAMNLNRPGLRIALNF